MRLAFASVSILLSVACEVDSQNAGDLQSGTSEAGGSEEGRGSCEAEVLADDFDRSCTQDADCVAVFEGRSDDACRECAFSAINVTEQVAYVSALGPVSCSAGPCGADCIQGHLQPGVCVEDQCEIGQPFQCGAGDSGGFEEGTVPCNAATQYCVGLEPNSYTCVPLPDACTGSTDCACLAGSAGPADIDMCIEQGSCEHDGATFQVRCPDG